MQKVYDVNGKQIQQLQLPVNGFLQKAEIDLSGKNFSSGMYLLEVSTGEKKEVFRLIKK